MATKLFANYFLWIIFSGLVIALVWIFGELVSVCAKDFKENALVSALLILDRADTMMVLLLASC